MVHTQSRQSAKLFSSRRNWDSPNPSPFGSGGERHTRWRERGWESPNSDEETYTVVLCKYMYFVVIKKRDGPNSSERLAYFQANRLLTELYKQETEIC
jgi:hypothetical protein